MSAIEHEWSLLQNQFDSYEKFSLIIKLVNITVFSAAYLFGTLNPLLIAILLMVWAQDAIWKTFQSRIEDRLLAIEHGLLNKSPLTAFQFNTEFDKNRPNTLGLIRAYAQQALRPTIAFPHAVLVLMAATTTVA
jgi:hypothetical protein